MQADYSSPVVFVARADSSVQTWRIPLKLQLLVPLTSSPHSLQFSCQNVQYIYMHVAHSLPVLSFLIPVHHMAKYTVCKGKKSIAAYFTLDYRILKGCVHNAFVICVYTVHNVCTPLIYRCSNIVLCKYCVYYMYTITITSPVCTPQYMVYMLHWLTAKQVVRSCFANMYTHMTQHTLRGHVYCTLHHSCWEWKCLETTGGGRVECECIV